jgi:general secretion pathway protein I
MHSNSSKGFTLVEVLVALSLLSIGVVAMLKVQGESAATAGAVRARVVAEIVAENRLVEALITPDMSEIGASAGEVAMAGITWRWRQEIAATANRDVQRIDVTVAQAPEDAALATLTAFRGRR